MSMEWSRARRLENQGRQRDLIESDGAGRWLQFSMSCPAELQFWLRQRAVRHSCHSCLSLVAATRNRTAAGR